MPDRASLSANDANGAPKTELASLLERIAKELEIEKQTRGLSTSVNGAWQIFHGILAYGSDFEIDTPEGRVGAIDYFIQGGECAGFRPSPGTEFPVMGSNEPRYGLRVEIQPTTKTGQGHRDQWLAVVAQAGLAPDQEWIASGARFTIMDWVRQAEFDVPLNYEEEFSWTLIPLSIYRSSDHRWRARDGETYSTELLLEVEILRDLEASVCGGTHRLIGIANAVSNRLSENQSLSGVWQQARDHLDRSIELAKSNQNADGSYGPWYLHRTGWCHDLGEMLGTTGHVLEFLAVAADHSVLQSDWVIRTATKLCDVLELCRGVDLECGVLYHALHGLVEYHRRLTEDASPA